MKYLANHEVADLATPDHIRATVDLLVIAHNMSVDVMNAAAELPPSALLLGARGVIDMERGRQAGLIAGIAAVCGRGAATIRADLDSGKLQARHDIDAEVINGLVVTEDDWQPRVVHKPTMTEDEFIAATTEQ